MLGEDTLRGSGVKSATGISKSIDRVLSGSESAVLFLDLKTFFFFSAAHCAKKTFFNQLDEHQIER